MLASVLIANRGEIACRIVRTLHRMGVRAVAVHSEADRDAMHVAMADEAVLIGAAAAGDSYLRGERVIEAAVRSGAEAIHPGYGFLSENAAFARACADAGLVFIGPRPEVIELMGEKDRAKAAMEAAGIPVVPGRAIDGADRAALRAAAGDLGYPVLIKATAGGGGRGMRVVRAAAEFDAALDGARREARAAFGDDRVILERYLEDPRHIEVQVFGDAHGNVVHLFERDCSVQRRHQKIVEEAPAPGLSEELRAELCDTAVRAAAAIGYTGAGTVEFLLAPDGSFYFIEMNTRLQVEHPVTELITGLDLVEWQLRVAAGEPLPLDQGEVRMHGHAIEVRLCAEDPAQGFVPSTGRLERVALPAPEPGLRLDTGVRAGDPISPHYDSLFAKLIVHDRGRASALRRLHAALASSAVDGVATNIGVLARIVGHPDFVAGGVGTGWLEERLDGLAEVMPPDDEAAAAAALWLLAHEHRGRAAAALLSPEPASPWHRTDGWRLNDRAHQTVRLRGGGREFEVLALADGDGYELAIGELRFSGRVVADGEAHRVTIDGLTTRADAHRRGAALTLRWRGVTRHFTVVDPLAEAEPADETSGLFTAPMPGRVVRVPAAAGTEVAGGAPLLVLEAMKMEHTIRAPGPGRLLALHVGEGEQVAEGTVLLDFEPA